MIDLSVAENAQEIFETLNARGTQLTAADLIKNFIFQKRQEIGADIEKAYERYWNDFETAFWEAEVSAGRFRYQRSSLFINHWLISVPEKKSSVAKSSRGSRRSLIMRLTSRWTNCYNNCRELPRFIGR